MCVCVCVCVYVCARGKRGLLMGSIPVDEQERDGEVMVSTLIRQGHGETGERDVRYWGDLEPASH